MTREHMLRFTTHYKETVDIFLLQIYWSTSVLKVTKIELGLTKLLQK